MHVLTYCCFFDNFFWFRKCQKIWRKQFMKPQNFCESFKLVSSVPAYSYEKNGSRYSWLLITQNLKQAKATIRIKHKYCSRQWEFELLNINFNRFCSEGTSERAWLLKVFDKGLYGVQFFECSIIKSQCVCESKSLFLWICKTFIWNLSTILQRYFKNWLFPSFSPSVSQLW